MESMSPVKWSAFGYISMILCFAFLLQITSAKYEYTNQLSSEFRNERNTTLTFNNTTIDLFNSTSNKLSNAAIQLNIIQNVVHQIAAALLKDNRHQFRYKRGITSPTFPSSNSSRLVMIENVINKMREQLEYLKSSATLSNDDKKRIGILESSIKEFQVILDNFQRDYAETIQSTTDKLETSILTGIAQSIKFRQFSFAEEQLRLTNDSIYEKVVQKVYNHKAENINLLLTFGSSVQNFEKKFKVYEALYNEMRTNGHADIQQLLRIVQSLRNGILDVATGTIADKSRSYICTLLEENRDKARTLISAAFLNDDLWSTVQAFKNETYRSCGWKLMGDVYDAVTDEVLSTLDIPKMLAKVDRNLKTIEERIIIHEAIIKKMERNGTLYTNNAVPLARSMKITWEAPGFISEDWRYRYKIIIQKLPSSLKNIVLCSSVCIKNAHFGEYLYAAEYNNSNYSGFRLVFTWMPKDKHESSEFMWNIIFDDDFHIKIHNVKYNESLTYMEDVDDSHHYAITSSAFPRIWSFEVDAEGVLVHYSSKDSYLFADETKRDDFRRYVFAFKGKPKYLFKWELVDCSNFP